MKNKAVILVFMILFLMINGCSKDTKLKKETRWDCTVDCAEKSNDESYIITYSQEKIVSESGTLSIQNKNDFDITVHLSTNGESERTADVPAGGISVLHEIKKDAVYTFGCHADVDEGTEISCIVFEGE